ncbi:hypothetical protein G5714_009877 [Onychostoma macrolepis]|uniref:Uncharacterized protein n=1 Tax=Onychostoma macrolepis TaxID=369639 RepID=A0A7J6CNZ0_9TELE|nr:hypothetical protein G5714_009877 [Onychostoma macrolepis]
MRDSSGVLQDKGQRETQPQDIPAPLSSPRWALEGPVNVWCVLADQAQDLLASTPGELKDVILLRAVQSFTDPFILWSKTGKLLKDGPKYHYVFEDPDVEDPHV